MKKLICFLLKTTLFITLCTAQQNMNWDDRSSGDWPAQTKVIHIKSTIDQSLQNCYLYKSTSSIKKPLIISLHTWGGNYAQRDPLLKYCIQANINYLHPDFRGPNNNPNAGGSYLVTQDIDDAIQWAIDSLKVDTQEIHIVGVSGGAFATLISYMKSKQSVKSFHAFVGIYNLADWYYESLQRKNNYANDILAITGTFMGKPDPKEVKKRSPLLMNTPKKQRINTKLNLYVGLHDGYTGSVPISHSLEMYNKVVNDFKTKSSREKISTDEMYTLLKRRILPDFDVLKKAFLGRDIIFQKHYKNLVEIIVFDGGHEMPDQNLLERILYKQ